MARMCSHGWARKHRQPTAQSTFAKLKGNKRGFVSKTILIRQAANGEVQKQCLENHLRGLAWTGLEIVPFPVPLQYFHVLTFHCLPTFFIWLLNLMIVCKYCESNWILWNYSGSFYCWNINWVNSAFHFNYVFMSLLSLLFASYLTFWPIQI